MRDQHLLKSLDAFQVKLTPALSDVLFAVRLEIVWQVLHVEWLLQEGFLEVRNAYGQLTDQSAGVI